MNIFNIPKKRRNRMLPWRNFNIGVFVVRMYHKQQQFDEVKFGESAKKFMEKFKLLLEVFGLPNSLSFIVYGIIMCVYTQN